MIKRSFPAWCAIALALAGCGDDASPAIDAAPEVDADPGTDLALAGLDGAVDVVYDDRGMPHIYATTVHDLMLVEGYVMAKDRFAQMELLRRNVLGTLAEVAGGLSPGIIATDRAQRFLGFARQGRAIYDSLPADSASKLAANAFVDGINQYIERVVKSPDFVPPTGSEALTLLMLSPDFGAWHPADIFALARYQAWNLSYDADSDITRTRALTGVMTAFPAAAPDPKVAARSGVYADFFTDRPARGVYTVDARTQHRAARSRLPKVAATSARPDPRSLAGAAAFFETFEASRYLRRDPHVGSNSWVVDGTTTESGNPILANDPHLSLISPPVWWYVHLNTAAMNGEKALDVQGVAFAGLPGVVLGFNRKLAWGATTTGYDVTDVYDEQITFRNDGTSAAPVWTPVSARFRGADVPITVIDEVIKLQGGAPETYKVYVVPHHGPLIPGSYVTPTSPTGTQGRALSVRYTGNDVSDELAFFNGLLEADTFADAEAAQANFKVGSQNFSFASATEGIRWSTQARIPVRDPRACTFGYTPGGVPTGTSPQFVLDGASGTMEWTGDLAPAAIPQEVNPSRHYIATSNQDNIGNTADANPCDDDIYVGGDFDVGYRQARIRDRLDAWVDGDVGITPADMVALQGETTSITGESMRTALIASIDHAIGNPSDDPALVAAMAALPDARNILIDFRTRLITWSFATPHGVGATDPAEIADSIATTVWNGMLTRLAPLAFNDEVSRITVRPGSLTTVRALEWALTAPTTMATYRTSYGGDATYNDSVLWDDLATPAVLETRDERVARAIVAAYAYLTTTLGADREQWRWGRLHTVRFTQIVPATGPEELVSIPATNDPTFPQGFPRHGDLGAVDPGNFGVYDTTNFSFTAGASQRLVVEMTPAGPVAVNALPGGQVEDAASPHHADEAELWRTNRQPPLYFERSDIDAHTESTLRFVPE